MSNSLEAKIVVLGSQGVGKTSLVHRFVKNSFTPPSMMTSTIGASFLTKRVVDIDSSTVVRLQIWDTAGQERFRSISKLYYRGANAALLCYDITSSSSFTEMGHWLLELRANLPEDTIIHVVGTKADVVAESPSKREVTFERCIAYVAENLYPSAAAGGASQHSAAPGTAHSTFSYLNPTASSSPSHTGAGPIAHHQHNKSDPNLLGGRSAAGHARSKSSASTLLLSRAHSAHVDTTTSSAEQQPAAPLASPHSNRSSMGFWGQDLGWDCCHEVSASSGEGVEEVFRVITRRLVEQRNARAARDARLAAEAGIAAPGASADERAFYDGYADSAGFGGAANGSFRVGVGDKRRSWLGLPQFLGDVGEAPEDAQEAIRRARRRKGCC